MGTNAVCQFLWESREDIVDYYYALIGPIPMILLKGSSDLGDYASYLTKYTTPQSSLTEEYKKKLEEEISTERSRTEKAETKARSVLSQFSMAAALFTAGLSWILSENLSPTSELLLQSNVLFGALLCLFFFVIVTFLSAILCSLHALDPAIYPWPHIENAPNAGANTFADLHFVRDYTELFNNAKFTWISMAVRFMKRGVQLSILLLIVMLVLRVTKEL